MVIGVTVIGTSSLPSYQVPVIQENVVIQSGDDHSNTCHCIFRICKFITNQKIDSLNSILQKSMQSGKVLNFATPKAC